MKAGIGLRAQHHDELVRLLPDIGWLEAHSENYFSPRGPQADCLLRLRERYPLSLHGVGLSLGSTDPLSLEHLAKLKGLIERTQPVLVSEHLSWGSVDRHFVNDLLPLPYTREALAHLCARVDETQEALGRTILIENISSYLQFAQAEMPEYEFLAQLARITGCGLLLDINNVYVNARNHGFDPQTFIASLQGHSVQELHLAGHSINRVTDAEILIDSHSTPVCDEVWKLFEFALDSFGNLPTLIEWDSDIPALDVLVGEAHKAQAILEHARDLAA